MKTHVAVYEKGLFDLRGGAKLFKGGLMPPLAPPLPLLKETLVKVLQMYMYLNMHSLCNRITSAGRVSGSSVKCGDCPTYCRVT